MNKIAIQRTEEGNTEEGTLTLSYSNANKMLPILRSDHFTAITLADTSNQQMKDLKFLIQLSRLLKADGSVIVTGQQSEELLKMLSRLNFYQGEDSTEGKIFVKTKPQPKVEQKKHKLAIGFKTLDNDDEIDQGDLLKEQNLEITKKKPEKCETKVRACANCNCGRKDAQEKVSKEELVNGINQGQPVSGCGKCYMGDSFRCGSCPYKGLPAFKPGDKLKLMEEGGVAVEEAATVVSANGKVKLEL